jgi:phosphoribosylcarboxyaminoimidazole (NCAIR) mutase
VPPSELVTVHKVPQRVVAYAGPFVAQGTMHIIMEATLSQALDVASEQFVALTNPSVLCVPVTGISLEGGLVLCLNRGKIMAVQAVG